MTEKYNWDEDPRPVCVIPDGGFSSVEQLEDCKIPKDYTGPMLSMGSQIVDKHGHLLDGDWDPKGKGGCDHRDTPEWKREHNKKHKVMKIKESTTEETTTLATVQVPVVEVKPPEKKPIGLEAQLPMIMGAIAGVVSSTAGPMLGNFVKNFLKNKLLKNKGDKQEEGTTDCKTSQVRASVRFNTIESRLSKLESDDDLGMSFGKDDIEEIVGRLERLEKKKKK